MFAAFLSAIGNAVEVTHSKRVMTDYHMPSRTFFTLGSTLIFFFMCVLLLLWGPIPSFTLNFVHLLLFGGVILVGFYYNYLYYYALKEGALCDVEPLAMLYPLVTMVLAVIIFPDERNYLIFIPGIIAAAVLVWSRIKPHHFKMKKATMAMLGFVILVSIEANLLKPLLEVVPPILLYTTRIGILATLFLTFTRPNLKKVTKASFWQTMIVALVVAIELPAYYYAIKQVGVVETSLIMLLGPVLILFVSKFFFKEKMTPKKIISSAIILACVATAIIIS